MLLCRLIPHIKLNMNGLSVDALNLLFHIYVYVVNITIKCICRSSIDTRALQIRLDLRIGNTPIRHNRLYFAFIAIYMYVRIWGIFFSGTFNVEYVPCLSLTQKCLPIFENIKAVVLFEQHTCTSDHSSWVLRNSPQSNQQLAGFK